ncbi:kinesin-like protein KIF3A [Coccinella septempunctata]|uniref:kinesin-like protein KIF3A n=1 Tax=Coccinella septempunctata TaxID=41139 RepID=UPI001D082FF2|nr:kinesin-like protein KIF3A [Coccinella septempunctata]
MFGDHPSKTVENVKVFIRIRPLNDNESLGYTKGTIEINKEECSILLNNNEYREFEKLFRFHQVFPEETSQQEIYHTVAAPIVDTVLKGYNGTIFAYGQTGSGKTYTMVGNNNTKELQGIIPNSFSQIFSQIASSVEQKSFVVTVTFLEIYNEEIRDLLSPTTGKKLVIHDHKTYGSFVKNLSGFTVNSMDELRKLFIRGNKNRTTKSNTLNMSSSRSHAIFTIMIESKNHSTNVTTFGKLNFVDLAGSERLSRTKVTGDMLKEASHINLSLSVLGNVISNLVDGKSSHVPYRNSKLTRLLQDSLGGNSKTAMIATLSLAEIDYDETVCTLRYASRVRYIKNYVSANKKTDGLIASFEKQIQELQNKVKTIQEEQETKRTKQYELKMKATEKKKLQEELQTTENVKQELMNKIELLQQKIIVGGVNLLDKVEEQNCLIEQSSSELVELHEKTKALEDILDNKNMMKLELKQSYSSLQEENEDLDDQISKVQEELKKLREEQGKQQSEQQFEMERRLDQKKALSQDLALYNLVLQNMIPKRYKKRIEANIQYDQDEDEFRLKHVAHAGNNIGRKYKEDENIKRMMPWQIKSPYIIPSRKY